jgi:hypothetical protein
VPVQIGLLIAQSATGWTVGVRFPAGVKSQSGCLLTACMYVTEPDPSATHFNREDGSRISPGTSVSAYKSIR